jgi:Subtilisin inhibitor-like
MCEMRRGLAALLLSLVFVSGAGGGAGSTSLVIRVFPDGVPKKATARTWTLSCRPARGSLPNPADACRKLLAVRAPFALTPPKTACTQIYGGPAVAYVVGTFRGHPVERWFNRRNGCQIARWNKVRFLFRH